MHSKRNTKMYFFYLRTMATISFYAFKLIKGYILEHMYFFEFPLFHFVDSDRDPETIEIFLILSPCKHIINCFPNN